MILFELLLLIIIIIIIIIIIMPRKVDFLFLGHFF